MDIQNIFAELIRIVGEYSNLVGASLFVLCLVTELTAISLPYVLETSLMLAGYSTLSGGHAFYNLLIIMAMSMSGRVVGASITYAVFRKGSKLMNKIRLLLEPGEKRKSLVNKLVSKINLMSPFSVAAGRLMGLRFPLTLILTAQGRLKTLLLGTMLASLINDSVYILIGAFVEAKTELQPFEVMVYFTVGLTIVYITGLAIQYFRQKDKIPTD